MTMFRFMISPWQAVPGMGRRRSEDARGQLPGLVRSLKKR
jgi:hypothetical protein